MHHFSFESLHSPVVHLDSYFQLQIEQLLYLLENELRNKRTQYLDVAWTLLDLILLSIFRNEANPVLANTFWSPLLTNIATNYQTITLSEAADIMGVSVRHFCRLFKRDYNCTFHEYMKTNSDSAGQTAVVILQQEYRRTAGGGRLWQCVVSFRISNRSWV